MAELDLDRDKRDKNGEVPTADLEIINLISNNNEVGRYRKTLKVHGYIDERQAIKLIHPDKSQKDDSFNIEFLTLEQGDDKMSSDNTNNHDSLKEDLRESERRITQDIRDRESRFEKTMERFMIDAKEREERFIEKADETKEIVRDGEKNRKSATIAMWTLAITTLVGIAAMVITVVITA